MRAFVQHPLVFAICSLAAILSGRVLAQADSAAGAAPAEAPEELTVRGRKTEAEYRLELERARDDIFRIFNAANEGKGTDITCRDEQATGRRIKQNVCRTNAENAADATSAQSFLNSLFLGSGSFRTNARLGTGGAIAGGSMINAVGTGSAAEGQLSALEQWEQEWRRLLSSNRDLYSAVVRYAELDDEYARARGATVAPLPDLARGAPPAQPTAPQCEATTLTEYSQRNNLALVSGTVSISSCPAGTTGSFTIVARVRNDADEANAIEFTETWQRADDQDHTFKSEYPIGENVFLQSLRVRNLTCTCVDLAE
jgi:hypothetical protein